jgi:hypothetical protein
MESMTVRDPSHRGPDPKQPAPKQPEKGDETRRFSTPREAKQFLIDWIVAEARRLNVRLSEVERKMLYAARTGWTPPDMAEVQDAFDRYHSAVEYEIKMTNLIRIARAEALDGGPEAASDWQLAVEALRGEDHYISQLIDAAAGPIRRRPNRWKLLLGALLILAAALATAWFAGHR